MVASSGSRLAVLIRQNPASSAITRNLAALPDESWAAASLLREREGFDVKLEWPVEESHTSLRVKAAGQRFFGLPVAPGLLRQLRQLSRSQDFLLANTMTWTIQVALASKLGLLGSCRSAAITFGLATHLSQFNGLKRRQWLWMLSGLDQIIVNTPVEADDLQALGLPNVSYLVFGVDPEFWSPAAGEQKPSSYVFSPGNDPLRDWVTLIDACRYPLVVASTSLPVDKNRLPATVTLTSGTLEDMKRLYANCRCAAVTLPDRAVLPASTRRCRPCPWGNLWFSLKPPERTWSCSRTTRPVSSSRPAT